MALNAYLRLKGQKQGNIEGSVIQKGRDKTIMVMRGHGVTVVGPTVHDAFDETYMAERTTMYQMTAMQTGMPLHKLPGALDDVCHVRACHWLVQDAHDVGASCDALGDDGGFGCCYIRVVRQRRGVGSQRRCTSTFQPCQFRP